MRRYSWLLFLALAGTAACVGDDDDTDLPGDDDDDDDDGEARVRAVHLAPNLAATDIVFSERDDEDGDDQQFRLDDLDYSDVSAYRLTDDGLYDLLVVDAEAPDLQDPLLQTTVDLDDDEDHTVVLWGSPDDLRVLRIEDDLDDLQGGEARVIVAHVALGAGEIDVVTVNGMAAPLADDLDAGETTSVDLAPGDRIIGVDLDDDDAADLLFELQDLEADALTHLLFGLDDDGDLVLLTLDADGRIALLDGVPTATDNGQVRFVNLADDDDDLSVDIWVDECPMPSVIDLEEGEATEYIPVIPGTYTLLVVPRNEHPDDALFDLELDIGFNEMQSIAFFDDLGEGRTVRLIDDNRNIQAGEMRLQLANTSAAFDDVDVYTIVGGTETLRVSLGFGDVRSFDVPVSARIGLDVDDDMFIDHVFDVDADDDRELINLYLLGSDDDPRLVAHYEDGDLETVFELDD